MSASLAILSVGVKVPRCQSVRSLVASLGGDSSEYQGWEHVCIAEDDDHPSTMAAHALEQALRRSEVAAAALKLVIFAGVSRDYVPSWSVATEVMRLCGVPSTCLGLDITAGCLGTLAALELIRGWLPLHGGGCAAVVTAERWSHTIDRRDRQMMPLWSHGDGGAALVVGDRFLQDAPASRPLGELAGTRFVSDSELNGHVLIKYGGTRHPHAPSNEDPRRRSISPTPRDEVRRHYRDGYGGAFTAMRASLPERPHRLVCNQISPATVSMIAEVAEVPLDRTVITGQETGHLGPADVILGLDRIFQQGPLDGPLAIAASAPYSFGAGIILPPQS
jgi:3-oxoacyl-[acyl-carrier-protein] synthase III